MLTSRNLLTTDFVLAKARCKFKRKRPHSVFGFHLFSVRRNSYRAIAL